MLRCKLPSAGDDDASLVEPLSGIAAEALEADLAVPEDSLMGKPISLTKSRTVRYSASVRNLSWKRRTYTSINQWNLHLYPELF